MMSFSVEDLKHPVSKNRERAFSCLERETRFAPDLPEPVKNLLVELLDADECWTVRLQVVRLFGRAQWDPDRFCRVFEYLHKEARGTNRFIQAWAIDSLSKLAVKHEDLHAIAWQVVLEGLGSPSAAVRVRARHAADRLKSV